MVSVVTTPAEARKVIAAGKLAVVIGMEVDNPFDCTVDNVKCNSDYVKTQLQTYYDLGVRHFFPIHFYDNAFGGSANSNFLISFAFTPPLTKRNCAGEGYQYDGRQCNAKGLTPVGKTLIREL